MLFLIISKANTPNSPIVKRYLQFGISPKTILSTAAKDPPKCQVPSIPMLTLPRYLGGRNSSIAVKIAVNSPPILKLTKMYLIPVKNRPNKKIVTFCEIIENKIPIAYMTNVI